MGPSTFVIRVRETTRGSAGVATALWSTCMAICLFGVAAYTFHGAHRFELLGVVATVAYAAYLGWRRRMGVAFVAPFVSWMFAWLPVWLGAVVRRGFWGIIDGFLYITIGWIFVAALEFLAIVAVGTPFRLLSGTVHHDHSVIIENPFRAP